MAEKKCCFTGYRPEKLAYLHEPTSDGYRKLYAALNQVITESIKAGYTYFISGFARGVDLMAAELVLAQKKQYRQVLLEAAIPCMNQTATWSQREKTYYYQLLDQADTRVCLDRMGKRDSYLKRNRYMVENTGRIIAVYDGQKGGTAYTVNYGDKLKREIFLVNPFTFKITEPEAKLF